MIRTAMKVVVAAALCDYITQRNVPLDERIPVGEHLRGLLGERYDRFDACYTFLAEWAPQNPMPALTSLALLRLSAV